MIARRCATVDEEIISVDVQKAYRVRRRFAPERGRLAMRLS
jgi:hypothetical protein